MFWKIGFNESTKNKRRPMREAFRYIPTESPKKSNRKVSQAQVAQESEGEVDMEAAVNEVSATKVRHRRGLVSTKPIFRSHCLLRASMYRVRMTS